MELFNVRGISIAGNVSGEGEELIVLLHGVGADKSCWKYQLEFFSNNGYKVAALDMRGTGDSQARDTSGEVLKIDREEFAKDVDAVVYALGYSKAHWIGNSMGGVIILEAIAQGLTSLDKIVLSNTFAKHPESANILPRPAKALATKSLAEFASERIPMTLRSDIDRETLDEAIYAMSRKDVEAYLATWRATWSPDRRDLLASIRNKTLVVGSDKDMITPLPLSQELADGIPGARLAVIENAGHIPSLDQPDQFNQIVLDFLQEK
jgi:pimeloyl-ACP methyl ester carboxylesterase